MKKNICKVLTTAFATALVVASPMTALTAHAQGFNFDAQDNDPNRGNVEDAAAAWAEVEAWEASNSGSSSSSGSSYVEPSYSEPAQSYTENNSSYSDNSGSSYSDNSSASSNTASSSSTVTAPAQSPNNVTVNVTGGQKFRITTNAEHTVYHIYHCGISRVTFKAVDTEGNAVAFRNVTLEKGEDNLWYAVINFAEGVDTTGLTVTAYNGDATYLSTELGVSGIKIAGEVVLSTVPVVNAE